MPEASDEKRFAIGQEADPVATGILGSVEGFVSGAQHLVLITHAALAVGHTDAHRGPDVHTGDVDLQ